MTNLCLIGMPGSGKTTIVKNISKRENIPYADTDGIISADFQLTIPEIFVKVGEAAFRDKESEVISALRFLSGFIISTGGGAVLRPQNIESLKKHSFIVYLEADAETLFSRLKNNAERPLLTGDVMKNIEKLLKERQSLYKGAADYTVNAALPVDEITERIIEKWRVKI